MYIYRSGASCQCGTVIRIQFYPTAIAAEGAAAAETIEQTLQSCTTEPRSLFGRLWSLHMGCLHLFHFYFNALHRRHPRHHHHHHLLRVQCNEIHCIAMQTCIHCNPVIVSVCVTFMKWRCAKYPAAFVNIRTHSQKPTHVWICTLFVKRGHLAQISFYLVPWNIIKTNETGTTTAKVAQDKRITQGWWRILREATPTLPGKHFGRLYE